jgi:SAM-dependent methyltransferase
MTDIGAAATDWSDVAEAWDEHIDRVDVHHRSATEALVERLVIEPGDRVLELASGPGSLGATWSRLAGPQGSVVLSDIAPGMLEVARRRNRGLGNVEFAIIDASAIDHPDASFDAVVSRMGLMFTPEPAVAFAEIRRVLAPGGRCAALTWGSLDRNPWMTCVGMAAMMSGIATGGPPVGPGSIFSLGDPDVLASLATAGGLDDVKVESIEITFTADDIAAHIARVSSLAGPLARAIAHADPEQLAAFHTTAAELAAPYVTDGRVEIPGVQLLVSGRA